ncbi:hypothetical protein B2904_orf1978 [Brachyspira pilosicoli B2904]|uniref:Uncharacterized protein n=1 Tax=Brachyspira pilosicoli B2904 TaxID=1133568 RepID=J9TZQ3_BRAPL|nr:hypothetical protein B2904_orf1978 [Brachyspira pilosicoli B2904]SUW04324.1 Uncharacterised protein [Brachyspira pilosicoli]SUW07989.1 Uncharacterised protein [Brachyspira pilosicoli]
MLSIITAIISIITLCINITILIILFKKGNTNGNKEKR